jgi:hypothetical protein
VAQQVTFQPAGGVGTSVELAMLGTHPTHPTLPSAPEQSWSDAQALPHAPQSLAVLNDAQ